MIKTCTQFLKKKERERDKIKATQYSIDFLQNSVS